MEWGRKVNTHMGRDSRRSVQMRMQSRQMHVECRFAGCSRRVCSRKHAPLREAQVGFGVVHCKVTPDQN